MAAVSGVGSFGAFTLKVTPEELKSKSQTITTEINNLRNALETMQNVARKTTQYWSGDAGDAHRELFESIAPIMDEVLNRYTEHNTSLDNIASNYIEAESEIVKASESLPNSPL